MRQSLATATWLAALLTSLLPSTAESVQTRADDFTSVCNEISSAISSASAVHWPGLDLAYLTDIGHWATSSSAQSACSVEPGTTEDVAAILQILAKNKTPFADTYPDLFFGLKGGFNNFGIVTKFNLTTHAQTEVWGGLITITEDQLDKVNAATVKFSQSVTDPKAQILPTYNFLLGQPGISLILFYDFPTPPAGIFDDFLAIPHFTSDVKTRPFLDLVKAAPANATGGQRAIFHTVSLLEYTDNIMAAVVNETKFWGQRLSLQTGNFISYDVEPFLPSIFSHSAEGSSAFPPSRAKGLLPLNIYYAWGLDLADDAMHDAARQSAAHLTQVVLAEGQDVADAALYGNYAIFDTPLERIYGGNLARLQALKAQYDPENVMGLAGGWKF
ncbi:hypothetical protein TRAPUB_5720 [Trametes pubescens]|uniref:Berberine/berberine-like domain-containing protein n=1 Tax=Trametes pubescens TaxID=154538 RepID=A0A1M2V7W3_TRAPU|nr:hypothetical protein TRAPUB_5720 [Trametes pubescens]